MRTNHLLNHLPNFLLFIIIACFALPALAAPPPARVARGLAVMQTSSSTTASPQVALAWTASASAATVPLTYTVLRADGACGATGQSFVAIQSGITGTSYTDATVTVGQAYSYESEAVSSSGVASLPSNCASAMIRPQPPTGLAATATGS